MTWIVAAAVVNAVLTLWWISRMPQRVAVRFSASGQPDGYMTRKGFALFSNLLPLSIAYFLCFTGSIGQPSESFSHAMESMAAGFIVFFSFLSWCIARSNRRSSPRIDYPSLALSIVVLLVMTLISIGGLLKSESSSRGRSVQNTTDLK